MLVYCNGISFELADMPFSRNNDGAIYRMIGMPSLAAKLYASSAKTPECERKLSEMLTNPPEETLQGKTDWPISLLHDQSGKFLGFTLPYSGESCQIKEPRLFENYMEHSWQWHLQAAENLCAVVHSIHCCGNVIGVFTPDAILFDKDSGAATLTQTDSYQIQSSTGKVFACREWDMEDMYYFAPEIHQQLSLAFPFKRNDAGLVFTKESDLFSMSVHIFMLLTGGFHPFVCTPVTSSPIGFSAISNIEMGIFPFVRNPYGVTPVFDAPSLSMLPKELQDLFLRAFCENHQGFGHRPVPEEWNSVLEQLEKQLVACKRDGRHIYWEGAASCPWCEQGQSWGPARKSKIPISFSTDLEEVHYG